MIGRIDIEQRVREWNLRADIVEKDYVLGWLLWGIGRTRSHGVTGGVYKTRERIHRVCQ